MRAICSKRTQSFPSQSFAILHPVFIRSAHPPVRSVQPNGNFQSFYVLLDHG